MKGRPQPYTLKLVGGAGRGGEGGGGGSSQLPGRGRLPRRPPRGILISQRGADRPGCPGEGCGHFRVSHVGWKPREQGWPLEAGALLTQGLAAVLRWFLS